MEHNNRNNQSDEDQSPNNKIPSQQVAKEASIDDIPFHDIKQLALHIKSSNITLQSELFDKIISSLIILSTKLYNSEVQLNDLIQKIRVAREKSEKSEKLEKIDKTRKHESTNDSSRS